METKANYVVVGAFTLLVMAACFAFILWVGGFSQSDNQVPLQIKINGSVAGLVKGSPVLFNGVNVGSIERTALDVDNPEVVIAHAQVHAYTPLRADTKANIGIQGLTGSATVELSGGSKGAVNLLRMAENKGEIAVIEAQPSAVTDLLATAQHISDRIDRVLAVFETMVVDNQGSVQATLKNVEAVTQTIADNREGIEGFLKGAGDVALTLQKLSEKMDGTISAVESITKAIDPKDVKSIVSNVADFTDKLDATTQQLEQTLAKVDGIISVIKPVDVEAIVGNVKQLSGDLGQTSKKLEGTLTKVDGVLDAVDKEKVEATLNNLAEATQTAKAAIDDVAKTASVIGDSNEDVKAIVSNVRAITDRLEKASSKVENVLVSLDGLLGDDSTKGLMSNAQVTIEEYRKLAKQLQVRVNEIAGSLNDFSKRGLGDVRSLVQSSQRSIQRIERAITKIGDNPSSILSSEPQVREYSGRPRR
jgi:phospholipid/cholesterol/gamma-HCH transport system substrate-binding protein